ncbi:hypothetical protein IE53DRAFT_839 [Violaceomyces palustris]|uniref:Uncharacterized protein n=1 Tax=Violaceomyces palustris TaxID=1673888 RepID=A0ACD0P8J8_9BASI|nr:hypothetical protein IE53DRAFT_839 [Violaceomyces palustris]
MRAHDMSQETCEILPGSYPGLMWPRESTLNVIDPQHVFCSGPRPAWSMSRASTVPYADEHWAAGDVVGDRVVKPRLALLRAAALLWSPRPRLEVLPTSKGDDIISGRNHQQTCESRDQRSILGSEHPLSGSPHTRLGQKFLSQASPRSSANEINRTSRERAIGELSAMLMPGIFPYVQHSPNQMDQAASNPSREVPLSTFLEGSTGARLLDGSLMDERDLQPRLKPNCQRNNVVSVGIPSIDRSRCSTPDSGRSVTPVLLEEEAERTPLFPAYKRLSLHRRGSSHDESRKRSIFTQSQVGPKGEMPRVHCHSSSIEVSPRLLFPREHNSEVFDVAQNPPENGNEGTKARIEQRSEQDHDMSSTSDESVGVARGIEGDGSAIGKNYLADVLGLGNQSNSSKEKRIKSLSYRFGMGRLSEARGKSERGNIPDPGLKVYKDEDHSSELSDLSKNSGTSRGHQRDITLGSISLLSSAPSEEIAISPDPTPERHGTLFLQCGAQGEDLPGVQGLAAEEEEEEVEVCHDVSSPTRIEDITDPLTLYRHQFPFVPLETLDELTEEGTCDWNSTSRRSTDETCHKSQSSFGSLSSVLHSKSRKSLLTFPPTTASSEADSSDGTKPEEGFGWATILNQKSLPAQQRQQQDLPTICESPEIHIETPSKNVNLDPSFWDASPLSLSLTTTMEAKPLASSLGIGASKHPTRQRSLSPASNDVCFDSAEWIDSVVHQSLERLSLSGSGQNPSLETKGTFQSSSRSGLQASTCISSEQASPSIKMFKRRSTSSTSLFKSTANRASRISKRLSSTSSSNTSNCKNLYENEPERIEKGGKTTFHLRRESSKVVRDPKKKDTTTTTEPEASSDGVQERIKRFESRRNSRQQRFQIPLPLANSSAKKVRKRGRGREYEECFWKRKPNLAAPKCWC